MKSEDAVPAPDTEQDLCNQSSRMSSLLAQSNIIVGGNETHGRDGQPRCLIFLVSIRQGCDVRAPGGWGWGWGGINQEVSILLSMAARVNKMIILINNWPNTRAGQKTLKDAEEKAGTG